STLELLATFPPNQLLPAGVVRRMSYALMDDPLIEALRFPSPHPAFRALVRAGLKARGRLLRFFPPRRRPLYPRDLPQIRSYPHGYRVEDLGTFPDRAPAAV